MTLRSLINIAVILLVAGFSGCTNDDQPPAATEIRITENHSVTQVPVATPVSVAAEATAIAKPESTPEPHIISVTTYHFTSNSERIVVDCDRDGVLHECGVSFADCGKDGAHSYDCQVGVHEWITKYSEIEKSN